MRTRHTAARLVLIILLACLLPIIGGTIFVLAVQQRVITPPNLHANLVLVRIDTARIVLHKCPAPPQYCMPQDNRVDEDIYTVRVSVYAEPHGPPVFFRQVMAVRLQPER